MNHKTNSPHHVAHPARSARSALAAELMWTVFSEQKSFSALAHQFFRTNKQCGKNDREEIINLAKQGFRSWGELLEHHKDGIHAHFGHLRGWAKTIWHDEGLISEATQTLRQKKPSLIIMQEWSQWLTQNNPHEVEDSRNQSHSPINLPSNLPFFWWQTMVECAQNKDLAKEWAEAYRRRAPLEIRINPWAVSMPTAQKLTAVLSTLEINETRCEKINGTTHGLRLITGGRDEQKNINLTSHPSWNKGYADPQSAASQYIAESLPLRKGAVMVDYCAGVGGKALALMARLFSASKNTASSAPTLLLCGDTHAHRLIALKERLAQSGADSINGVRVETFVHAPQSSEGGNTNESRLSAIRAMPERYRGRAFAVLVDAPCTGMGTLRHAPELAWRLSRGEIYGMLEVQKSILHHAAQWVAPKGYLLYATCSWWHEENERQIEAFLSTHSDFAPAPLPRNVVSALISHGDEANTPPSMVATNPVNHKIDGYFWCLLQRH